MHRELKTMNINRRQVQTALNAHKELPVCVHTSQEYGTVQKFHKNALLITQLIWSTFCKVPCYVGKQIQKRAKCTYICTCTCRSCWEGHMNTTLSSEMMDYISTNQPLLQYTYTYQRICINAERLQTLIVVDFRAWRNAGKNLCTQFHHNRAGSTSSVLSAVKCRLVQSNVSNCSPTSNKNHHQSILWIYAYVIMETEYESINLCTSESQ